MTSTVLAKVRAKQQQADEKATAAYDELVEALVFETIEPEPAAVLKVLDAAGVTAEELTAIVGTRQRRIVDYAKIQAADSRKERRAEIQHLIDAAAADLRKAEQKHAAIVRPLGFEMDELNQLDIQAIEIRRRLRDSCPNKALQRRIDALSTYMAGVQSELREARQSIERADNDREIGIQNHRITQAEIDTYLARAKRAREKMTELNQRQAEYLAEQNELVEQQSRP